MNEELAYSIHLGSDKNRTNKAKEIAKNNPSGTTSFSNNAIQNAKQLSDANKHNLRDYDKNRDDIFMSYLIRNLNKNNIPNSGYDKLHLLDEIIIKDFLCLLNLHFLTER